jgi:putative spermidine/putrescine transport system permease protein
MKSKNSYLALPGAIFMGISLGLVIVYTLVVSFWSMKGFIMVPSWTVQNYVKIFLNWRFLSTILFTIKEALIVLAIVLIISYPVAYFLSQEW